MCDWSIHDLRQKHGTPQMGDKIKIALVLVFGGVVDGREWLHCAAAGELVLVGRVEASLKRWAARIHEEKELMEDRPEEGEKVRGIIGWLMHSANRRGHKIDQRQVTNTASQGVPTYVLE